MPVTYPNNFADALAGKILPKLDTVFQARSKTAVMDQNSNEWSFVGSRWVKYYKMSMDGQADYRRNEGYAPGGVSLEQAMLELQYDRGRQFLVDEMDNEETMGIAFGKLAGEYMRTKVIPEVDAYRFAKYASTPGIGTATADLTTPEETMAAIRAGELAVTDAGVDLENCILFITNALYFSILDSEYNKRTGSYSDTALNRKVITLDDMRVVTVPQNRFYSAIDLKDGWTEGEKEGHYTKAADAQNLNFMIIPPSAVIQITKHEKTRVFDPNTTQQANAWKLDYRLYQDCFVTEANAPSLYAHMAAGE